MHWNPYKMRLILVTCLGMSRLAVSPSAWAAECIGPPPLEAQVRAHPNANTYAALGTWFAQNHSADCAVQAFQSGLKLDSSSARLNYFLGLSLYNAGRMQEAVSPLQQYAWLRPEELIAHLMLGAALSSLGRDNEALPEWEAALKIDPTSKKALDGLATALMAAGDYESVIGRLRSAPRNENLTLDLAGAYVKLGLFDEGARVLTEGLKAYPSSNDLTRALVTLYFQEGRTGEGLAEAERLARLKPHDIEAQRIYLRTLVITGKNFEIAAPLSRKLLALVPNDPEILAESGFLERMAGDYLAARKHLEEAVILLPNNPMSRFNLGVVLAELQDAAGAREQLEKAVELGATEPQVRFELAKVLQMLGETDKAQQQLKLYQQKTKEEADRSLASLKSTEAVQALKAGDNRKAADLYREACAAQPYNAGYAYRLALVLGQLGDIEGERTALEQAIKADANFVVAQYDLGRLDFRAGSYAAAERQFRLTVKAVPGKAEAWIALAATLGAELRVQEARDALANALKLEPNNAAALDLGKKLAAAQDQNED
jgi:Flp pilus assembly protein TadD